MKTLFAKDVRDRGRLDGSFMIMKKIANEDGRLIAYIGDKTGDMKASIPDSVNILDVGDVIKVKGKKDRVLEVDSYKMERDYNLNDYLPTINRSIEEIMYEIKKISDEEFKSEECRALDAYFFNNKPFVEKFKNGIGGLRQHHNYIGGLAEHTLNVMYLAKTFAYRYDCRNKDIAILAAKIHDIGKIEEYNTDGPFSVTMSGEMEGHIVIGISMLEKAFLEGGDIYSEEFKHRIKACVVQHHGKVEFGSPKVAKTEEAFIVHFADYVDAMLNKIGQVKEITEPQTWSEYDRRIGTRLYM